MIRIFIIILFLCSNVILAQEFVEVSPSRGDGISSLLKLYQLQSNTYNLKLFKELNEKLLGKNERLSLNKKYRLPINLKKFNGKSIRTSLGITDYNLAKSIERYNNSLLRAGVKKKSYKRDQILWVPLELIKERGESEQLILQRKKTVFEPLFGKKYSKVNILNHELENCIFYLISGHGGPDPGAIGYNNGKELHEDEYAYDVVLRLGRKLIEKGALVYMLIQDSADGIRDVHFLNNSDMEINLDGSNIPVDQLERLSKRVRIANSLYETNLNENILQFAIEIHVDSRIEAQNIDIFFYHKESDNVGKKFAETLKNTIEKKYQKAQPGRGYEGSLSSRNLYMVKNLKPTTAFIEIGNIQNTRDQKRIMVPNNRQAIANWISDGISNFIK